MNKNILLIITAAAGAFIGWLVSEPWTEDFGPTRDLLILIIVGLLIVLSIVSFNYFYYKKFDLLKKTLKNPFIYLLPIIGAVLAKLLFSFQGEAATYSKDESQNNVVMILDVSSSMAPKPIKELKKAVKEFIEVKQNSRSSDKIAVISFEDEAHMLSRYTNNYERLLGIIPSLTATGGRTSMGMGLEMANAMFNASSLNEIPTRFLLLTDGDPSDIDIVYEQIDRTIVPIDVIGVGRDYNEQLCSLIASNTGGKFYPADDISKLTNTFREIAGGELTQAGGNLPIGYRILGWVLFGVFLGLAINIHNRKKEKIIIGLFGGVLAGLLSSVLFAGIEFINIYGTVARLISFVLFAIILALSLIWVETMYKKLSGSNKNNFDNLKIKNKKD